MKLGAVVLLTAAGMASAAGCAGTALPGAPKGCVEDASQPSVVSITIASLGYTIVSGTMTPTFLVPLHVSATFGCPVIGGAHATLVTSAGSFTSTSSTGSAGGGGGGGGGATDSGASSGGAGAGGSSSSGSLTILLSGNSGTTLDGFTTLQLVNPHAAYVQVAIGDQSQCVEITGELPEAGTPDSGTVTGDAACLP